MNKKSESIRPVLVVTFGVRMREARELCGYSQVRAAKLLGYQNSSKLNRVELASDGNSIPFWLIPRAAEVYEVSCDFLLGLSDSWQCNHTKALQSQIEKAIQLAQPIQTNPIRQLYNLVDGIESAISINLKKSAEIKDLVNRIRLINPHYDTELKLGAKLLRLAEEANQEACRINQQLTEHRKSIHNSIF